MHISQFASTIRCPCCSLLCATTQWPVNGDRVPFYAQRDTGKFQVPVDCGHCGKRWYVVWDEDPGPIQTLFGSTSTQPAAPPRTAPTTSGASGLSQLKPGTRTDTNTSVAAQQESLAYRLGRWLGGQFTDKNRNNAVSTGSAGPAHQLPNSSQRATSAAAGPPRPAPVSGPGPATTDLSGIGPELALSKATALTKSLGRPTRFCTVGASDELPKILLQFSNGDKYIFSDFRIGYHGTGPQFFAHYLGSIGSRLDLAAIAAMQPPCEYDLTSEEHSSPAVSQPRASASPAVPAVPSVPDGMATTTISARLGPEPTSTSPKNTIWALSIVTNRAIPMNQADAWVKQVIRMKCKYGIYEDLMEARDTKIGFAVAGDIDFQNPMAVVPVLLLAEQLSSSAEIPSLTFGDFSDTSSGIRGCVVAHFRRPL